MVKVKDINEKIYYRLVTNKLIRQKRKLIGEGNPETFVVTYELDATDFAIERVNDRLKKEIIGQMRSLLPDRFLNLNQIEEEVDQFVKEAFDDCVISNKPPLIFDEIFEATIEQLSKTEIYTTLEEYIEHHPSKYYFPDQSLPNGFDTDYQDLVEIEFYNKIKNRLGVDVSTLWTGLDWFDAHSFSRASLLIKSASKL